jgi:hypothetical protein
MSAEYEAMLPLVIEGETVARDEVEKDALLDRDPERERQDAIMDERLECAEALVDGVNKIRSSHATGKRSAPPKVPIPLDKALQFCRAFREVETTDNADDGPLHEALKKLVSPELREAFVASNLKSRTKADAMDGLGLGSTVQMTENEMPASGGDEIGEASGAHNDDSGDEGGGDAPVDLTKAFDSSQRTIQDAKAKADQERDLTDRLFSLRTVVDGQKRPTPELAEALDLWGAKLEDLEWEDDKKQQLILKLHPQANWGLTTGQIIDSAALVGADELAWRGAILGNACGTGKTVVLLAAIYLAAKTGASRQASGERTIFQPSIYFLPPSILPQAVKECIDKFDGLLHPKVFYAD